ncbi:ETC complex I subunit [Alphaproteobacteria bacterium]|nr:ETC complex I subunit [Alphaproteobacteria bacterium]
MFDVIIYQPRKMVARASCLLNNTWVLEFSQKRAKPFSSKTGWCGSKEPLAHHKLTFSTLKNAVQFAESSNLSYLCC